MLRLLTIHEAVPGHYLQGVYGNRCPSIARSLFYSGVFAEGWAVYVTQVMMDAGSLMIDGAFQEEAQAGAKYNRARLTSTQLSTYFVGSLAFWDLEDEIRRRAAVAAEAPGGADSVPAPRVVGGYGETPGFVYR